MVSCLSLSLCVRVCAHARVRVRIGRFRHLRSSYRGALKELAAETQFCLGEGGASAGGSFWGQQVKRLRQQLTTKSENLHLRLLEKFRAAALGARFGDA